MFWPLEISVAFRAASCPVPGLIQTEAAGQPFRFGCMATEFRWQAAPRLGAEVDSRAESDRAPRGNSFYFAP